MSDEQEDEDREPIDVQDDPYVDVGFGKRRPDAIILDKAGKNIFVLEFKRTSIKGVITEKEVKQEPQSSTTFLSRAFKLL